MVGQRGFFDLDERYAALSNAGDPLEKLNELVDFEMFRADLDTVLDRANTGSKVWADTACRSKKNEKRIAKAGRVSKVHFRKPKGKVMPQPQQKANAARSKVRSHVEHVFARQKGPMQLFIRTIGITGARTKIGMATLAYNMQRYLFRQGKLAGV